jgi:hypothetical protein
MEALATWFGCCVLAGLKGTLDRSSWLVTLNVWIGFSQMRQLSGSLNGTLARSIDHPWDKFVMFDEYNSSHSAGLILQSRGSCV